jgi:hypothetical protein
LLAAGIFQQAAPCNGEEGPSIQNPSAPSGTTEEKPARDQPKPTKPNDFLGLKLGIGLSATWDTVNRRRVEDASIDSNGIVRVNKASDVATRVMLESHYFFPRGDRMGWGPFVAIEPGSGQIVNAFGAGLMFGFKKGDANDSFNVGIGYSTDPKTKVLGDEFRENFAAPLGAEGKPLPIRLVERDQGAFILLVSFTWGQ